MSREESIIQLSDSIEIFGTTQMNLYPELSYTFEKKDPLNPQSLTAKFQAGILDDGTDFTRFSITANQEVEYNKMGKKLSVRLFFGKFIQNNTTHPRYNWRADGTIGSPFRGAYTDFAYDRLFLGRTETTGVLSQQFYEDQGGFKVFNAVGQSNDWIGALNVKVDLPVPLPIGMFTDLGMNANKDFTYDIGFHIEILKDMIEIYVPLDYSKNIEDALDISRPNFQQRIRFILNLSAMDPIQVIDNLDL